MAKASLVWRGRVFKYGDNLSTDHMLPSRFMSQVEPHELAANCLAGVDPDFAKKVRPGDILVAGFNAGYGSSREQAPQALKYAGVAAVVAKSFARIFFRNCFNVGLPAIVCPAFVDAVAGGEVAEIDLEKGVIGLEPDGAAYPFARPPAFLLDYIRAGGLMLYLKNRVQKSKDKGQN